jgi:hypothetical protein
MAARAVQKRGIEYWPSDKPKSELYLNLFPALNSGLVALLDNDRLVTQLCGLERRTARSGRDSIDHAPGAHDDLANAVAGVIQLAVAEVHKSSVALSEVTILYA